MQQEKYKPCSTCKIIKSIDLFPKNRTRKGGYSSECKVCAKARRDLNIKDLRAYNLRYKNEKKGVIKEQRKSYTDKNAEKIKRQVRSHKLKSRYKITENDYNKMLISQGGRCQICRKMSKLRLDIDHCHATNAVRGLLCGNCNRGLGLFMENIAILQKAIEYIKKYNI